MLAALDFGSFMVGLVVGGAVGIVSTILGVMSEAYKKK